MRRKKKKPENTVYEVDLYIMHILIIRLLHKCKAMMRIILRECKNRTCDDSEVFLFLFVNRLILLQTELIHP
jgi:hypothetical protein